VAGWLADFPLSLQSKLMTVESNPVWVLNQTMLYLVSFSQGQEGSIMSGQSLYL